HPPEREARLLEALGSGPWPLRREGWLRDAPGREGDGRGDQESGQAIGDPHLSGRGPRVLQRRAARGVQQCRGGRRLETHARPLPPAPEVAGRAAGRRRATKWRIRQPECLRRAEEGRGREAVRDPYRLDVASATPNGCR